MLATYKANYVEVTAQLIHVDTGYSLRKATEVVSKAFDKITNELIRMNIDSNSGSRIYRFHLNEVDRKIGSFQVVGFFSEYFLHPSHLTLIFRLLITKKPSHSYCH